MYVSTLNVNFKYDMHTMSGGEYDTKIKTTIGDVHYTTKVPTLSSGALHQHYAIIRANIYILK